MLIRPSWSTHPARLQFSDADSCVAWLETIPLDRITEAHELVSTQVGLVVRGKLATLERVRVLEVLYQTAMHLQSELARCFIGQALPLSIVQYAAWSAVVELWQVMYAGYLGCLRRCLSGDGTLAAHSPLLAFRSLEISGALIREYHRVYREVPATLWQQLHESYSCAESRGFADAHVRDPLRPPLPTATCVGVYTRTMLAHLSNPYTLSPRQMDVMYRWAQLWESLVILEPSAGVPATTAVLAVDLRSGMPAVPAHQVPAGPSARYLSVEPLGQALRRALTLLRCGREPGELGLGQDCRQPGCERLLTLLYIQWCGSGVGHLDGRHERGDDARACVGLGTIVRQLACESEAFRSGGVLVGTAYSPLTERWSIASIKAPGFIGVARGPECDARIAHHQLVAVKQRGASAFRLAVTQWLKLEADGELSIGLRLLPGVPELLGLRGPEDAPGALGSAILLPATPEMRSPATLVLPPEAFVPGRRFELLGTAPQRVRLSGLAERGLDFVRVVFEVVG